jgi:hypothetical protein
MKKKKKLLVKPSSKNPSPAAKINLSKILQKFQ